MALGPGTYDDLATEVREKANAAGVILIVVDGQSGMGFSAQLSPALSLTMPTILRQVADDIEADLYGGTPQA